MKDLVKITEAMLHVVGFDNASLSSDPFIRADLFNSESGLCFQHVHPLVTIINLESVAPDFRDVQYPLHDANKSYRRGALVTYDGTFYKCKSAIEAHDFDESEWSETSPFSEWLESKVRASISKALFRFCNDKYRDDSLKALVENKYLFDGAGRLTDTITNANNLVGFEVVPIRTKGAITRINKIGLQFTSAGDYTIYLMQSGSSTPIDSQTLHVDTPNSVTWFGKDNGFDGWSLPYSGDSIEPGGSWYVCYRQSELPANSKAVRKVYDWAKGPCGACSRSQMKLRMAWSPHLEIHPFSVNEELLPENHEMWDVEYNIYDYETNYGLNLEVSVECDISDTLIEQRLMFADVIGKQFAVDTLREFVSNPAVRTNRNSINASRPDIIYQLDGDSAAMRPSGLSNELTLALQALELNFKGYDRLCLPCANHGIKIKTT